MKNGKKTSYTYTTSWKADADGMAAVRDAKLMLGEASIDLTQKRIIDLCCQAYFEKLSAREIVDTVRPLHKAERNAKIVANHNKEIAAHDKEMAALKEKHRQTTLDLQSLLAAIEH